MLSIRTFIFALAICTPTLTYAKSNSTPFPGPVPSLADLWQNSECVVHGKVLEVIPLKAVHHGQQIYSYGAQNIIKVENLLKGDLKDPPKFIMVKTEVTSEAPCHFTKGTSVLAFLDKEDHTYSAGASHSRIVLKKGEFKHYEKPLKLLPKILDEKDEVKRTKELVEWYVNLAAEPVTRIQGSRGLSWARARNKDKQKSVMSESQKERLVNVIVGESPPVSSSARIVNVLSSHPSEKLDQFLLEALRRSHEPDWEDLTRTAFDTLPKRLKIELSAETKKRTEDWSKLLSEVYYNFDKPKPDRKQKELSKERYHIVWGSLTFDVYNQCKSAMKKKLP